MAESRYPATRGAAGFISPWDEFMRRFAFPWFFERPMRIGTFAPVDVCERNNDYVIRMACPGCRPQDLEITVENDVVRIRGKFPSFEHTEQPTEQAAQGATGTGQHETCLIRELPTGRFERDITLPTAVNAQGARAVFENGLLTLTLPKAQAARGHHIPISVGQPAGTGSR